MMPFNFCPFTLISSSSVSATAAPLLAAVCAGKTGGWLATRPGIRLAAAASIAATRPRSGEASSARGAGIDRVKAPEASSSR